MSDLKQKRETYRGAKADRYEATRQGPFWDREQKVMGRLVESMERSVLDAPVGTGRFLPLYEARGLKVTGVDLSADMLRQARRKGTGAELLQGDVFALDFPDGAFDFAVCVRLLNWLETDELVGALAELGRVARTVIAGAGTKTGPVKLKSVQRIHEEAEFLAQVEAAGLSVVARHLVERNDRGLFEFWELAPAVPAS